MSSHDEGDHGCAQSSMQEERKPLILVPEVLQLGSPYPSHQAHSSAPSSQRLGLPHPHCILKSCVHVFSMQKGANVSWVSQ